MKWTESSNPSSACVCVREWKQRVLLQCRHRRRRGIVALGRGENSPSPRQGLKSLVAVGRARIYYVHIVHGSGGRLFRVMFTSAKCHDDHGTVLTLLKYRRTPPPPSSSHHRDISLLIPRPLMDTTVGFYNFQCARHERGRYTLLYVTVIIVVIHYNTRILRLYNKQYYIIIRRALCIRTYTPNVVVTFYYYQLPT